MLKQQVLDLVIECVRESGKEDKQAKLLNAGQSTPLYGLQGNLDSLGLVRLIIDIEEKISDRMHMNIVIASEKAMSERRSPFLTVESLSDFIVTLLNFEGYV